MQKQIDNIEKEMRLISDAMRRIELKYTEQVTRIETRQNTLIKISSMLFTGLLASVAQLFGVFK
ncbi:MAG: hypothetical protein GTO02_14280 [Candidatus Dadabacteria bacterium]|nr:hypothetical protein [Candidatus Dadabacteria bacterium]